MNKEELQAVLEAHEKWLNGEIGGKKANLRGADLRKADLHRADLIGTDLSGAYLDYSCLPLWYRKLKGLTNVERLR